jgi:hypothetical protein
MLPTLPFLPLNTTSSPIVISPLPLTPFHPSSTRSPPLQIPQLNALLHAPLSNNNFILHTHPATTIPSLFVIRDQLASLPLYQPHESTNQHPNTNHDASPPHPLALLLLRIFI